MWLFKQPSTAARTVLIYITAGALMVIWSAVWYFFLWNNLPAVEHGETHPAYYWCTGFMVTGLILVFIGLMLGWLGRSDKDLRREEASSALLTPAAAPLVVVNPAPTVAASAPVAVPANPVAVGVSQNYKPV